MMIPAARFMIILGLVLLIGGGLLLLAARVGLPLGRLPGTIRIQGEIFTCVVPLLASILLSILLTILLNVFARILNR
jgi:hypothetical protein